MYESLVLGRSLKMYRVIFFLKNIFLQILPTVRGNMNNTLQQCRDSACTQVAYIRELDTAKSRICQSKEK